MSRVPSNGGGRSGSKEELERLFSGLLAAAKKDYPGGLAGLSRAAGVAKRNITLWARSGRSAKYKSMCRVCIPLLLFYREYFSLLNIQDPDASDLDVQAMISRLESLGTLPHPGEVRATLFRIASSFCEVVVTDCAVHGIRIPPPQIRASHSPDTAEVVVSIKVPRSSEVRVSFSWDLLSACGWVSLSDSSVGLFTSKTRFALKPTTYKNILKSWWPEPITELKNKNYSSAGIKI